MSADLARSESAPRPTRMILLDRNFGLHFSGKLVAALGVWISNIVAAVTVFDVTGSAFLVGAVSLAQFLPQVTLGPLAGSLADRGNRIRLMVVGRLTSAIGAGVLAAWSIAVGIEDRTGVVIVIAAAGIIGSGSAVGSAATHAVLPALVRPSELSTAVALDGTPYTVARAVGPAIGALILAAVGPGPAFAVASATFALNAAAALALRLGPVAREAAGDRTVRAGLRYLRGDRRSALLLAGVAAVGLGIDPVLTLAPPLAAQLGGTDQLVGWLVSAFGIGSALAIATMGPVRAHLGITKMSQAGFWVFAGAYVGATVASSAGQALVAFLFAGAGMMLTITSLTTQLQTRLPEEFRGRIMAIWAVAYLGSRPVAAAINGALADQISVKVAFLFATAVLLAGSALTRGRNT